MANTPIKMQQIRAIIQLLDKGYSYRGIARELKIHRNTVTQYHELLSTTGLDYATLRQLTDEELAKIVYPDTEPRTPDDPRRADFNLQLDYFLAELKRTGVTRYLLWEEYRKNNPTGYQYTQFCILLKDASLPGRATMHLNHRPAEMMMADFAGDNLHYVDRATGELIGCPVFVAVLPFSGLSFAIALPDATLPQLIKAQNACLAYFGCVPQAYKTDNMRQVVRRACRYEPLFTDAMQQWSLHYNITLLSTRVRKPKDKAPVENEVKIAYQRIYAPLRNRVFYSLKELNEAISIQLKYHNDKDLQRKDYCRRKRFEEQEKALMQPLPIDPFVLKHKTEAKVQNNYHITLGEDWHHYSVPYTYIGKTVQAVYDTDIVEIYYQLKRIALHQRSYKRHDYTTTPHHMPEGHRLYQAQLGWTPEYFLERAAKVGPDTVAYIGAILNGRRFTEQTYNACRGLLRLQQDYGADRLELACRLALKGAVFNYRTVQNILVNNQDKLAHSQPELFQLPTHTNLRGRDAYN